MAAGSLNLKVSKEDFENRIQIVELRMNVLADVIQRYADARTNLDQFIEEGDSNYQAMVERVEANATTAKKAHAALNEVKMDLMETVNKMEGMGAQIKETISSATEAATSSVNAAIKIQGIL